jgi:phospholipase C
LRRITNRRLAAGALALVLTGCGASNAVPPVRSDLALRARGETGAGKIAHIVYIVQENRSFNDLFMGYPHATTVGSAKNSKGKTIVLKPVSLKVSYAIEHGAKAMFAACDGSGRLPGTHCTMDGFDLEGSPFKGPIKNPAFVYVPLAESKPYWDMAHEFVLADEMFSSQLDESFVAHQYVVAGQAQSSVDVPLGKWGCEGGPGDTVQTITKKRTYGPSQPACFDYQTLGDELDRAGLSWRFYTSSYNAPSFGGLWSGYQAVRHIYYGPDWHKDVITPQRRFLRDVAAGRLAAFTWVTPLCIDSDHVSCGGGFGPSWVSAVVNAVGKSKFWNSTAIFVQWDDWGGMYDPVPPPFKDYDSLGFRVPLIVISPYARKDYVSHTQYETASVLRFAEDLFGLGHLSVADARANSPAEDCFNFDQKPRKFVPIEAPQGAAFFLKQPLDPRIPDTE